LTRCSDCQPFTERGYFATKKWTTSLPAAVEAAIGCIEEMNDAAAILGSAAATIRNMREAFGDLMRMLVNRAPHDKAYRSPSCGHGRVSVKPEHIAARFPKPAIVLRL
jgi:hypothetical protein